MSVLLIPPGMDFTSALRAGLVPVIRSRRYLAFVATLPCAVTGAQGVVVHHLVGHGLKGAGEKASDLLTFPLAPELHDAQSPVGLHRLGHKEWERRYGDQRLHVFGALIEAIHRGAMVEALVGGKS